MQRWKPNRKQDRKNNVTLGEQWMWDWSQKGNTLCLAPEVVTFTFPRLQFTREGKRSEWQECAQYTSEVAEVSNRMGSTMHCLGTAKMKWNQEFKRSDASEECSGLQSQCSCSMCCHPQCLARNRSNLSWTLGRCQSAHRMKMKKQAKGGQSSTVFSLHLIQIINVRHKTFYWLFLILFVSETVFSA